MDLKKAMRKRVGAPMNEMRKRVGAPMNEMKRSKFTEDVEKRLNNAKTRHDELLKDAINALEMLKLSEQGLLMMKRKRNRFQNNKRTMLPALTIKKKQNDVQAIVEQPAIYILQVDYK